MEHEYFQMRYCMVQNVLELNTVTLNHKEPDKYNLHLIKWDFQITV